MSFAVLNTQTYRMVWCKLVLKESIVTRDNYSYKKYQKELARKKKAEEKKQRKLNKNIQASEQACNEDVTVV